MKPLRVLLADDDPKVSEMFGLLLERDGHSVEFAADGKEALRKVQQNKFDLIISDQRMPHINGEQLAALISTRRIPFVLLSGLNERNGDPRTGVSFVLAKPISAYDLREAVEKAVSLPMGYEAPKH